MSEQGENYSMSKSHSRRAVLAGIATAPALTAPALALTVGPPDPIFAAIERHKVAFRISQEAGRIRAHMVYCERALLEASSMADDAADNAANELITVQPATMAGVLALIRHVEAFNAGAFFLEPYPGVAVSNWQSAPMFWPELKDEDDIDLFGYAVLANVRRALEAMAAVS
jgi:hypothetical protein